VKEGKGYGAQGPYLYLRTAFCKRDTEGLAYLSCGVVMISTASAADTTDITDDADSDLDMSDHQSDEFCGRIAR